MYGTKCGRPGPPPKEATKDHLEQIASGFCHGSAAAIKKIAMVNEHRSCQVDRHDLRLALGIKLPFS